jgi:hypothetical protein
MQQAGGEQHAHRIRVEAFRRVQVSLRIFKGSVCRRRLESHDFRFCQRCKRLRGSRTQTGCLLKLRYRLIKTLIVLAQKIEAPIIEGRRLWGESPRNLSAAQPQGSRNRASKRLRHASDRGRRIAAGK